MNTASHPLKQANPVVAQSRFWYYPAMENNTENNGQNNVDDNQDLSDLQSDLPAAPQTDPKVKKRKALEAIGCLLYVIAFLIMGSVLLVKFGKL
jgi:hypothetical protein